MTTVGIRTWEIRNREKFDIVVMQNGQPVNVRANGLLGPYPFRNKLKDAKTVASWKAERFEPTYPGYTCDVLMGDGATAAGNALLTTVRQSY